MFWTRLTAWNLKLRVEARKKFINGFTFDADLRPHSKLTRKFFLSPLIAAWSVWNWRRDAAQFVASNKDVPNDV